MKAILAGALCASVVLNIALEYDYKFAMDMYEAAESDHLYWREAAAERLSALLDCEEAARAKD